MLVRNIVVLSIILVFCFADVNEYNTAYERVYLGNLVSFGGDSQYGELYYPTNVDPSVSLPFISFAHGMLAGGEKMRFLYESLLSSIASAGYIVVGAESCIWAYCPIFYEDILQTIDACKVNGTSMNPIFNQADFSNVGIVGHSMGGGMTEVCCQEKYTSTYNIKTGFALNPEICIGCTSIDVPIFYGAGTNDTIVPDNSVLNVYNQSPPPKVFANMENCTHFEPNLPNNRWIPIAVEWLDCFLKGNLKACNNVYGSNSFCNNIEEFPQCFIEMSS